MTEKELNQLYFLNKEINQQRKRLKELQEISKVKSPIITGMPHNTDISNSVESYVADVADLEAEITLNLQKCWYALRTIEEYINNINDSEIRQIMRLRYISGYTWDEIGYELHMNRRTVSRKCHRFIKDAHNAHSICDNL